MGRWFGGLFGSFGIWLRGQDLNLRPSGYEPDELPGCSTPRRCWWFRPAGPKVPLSAVAGRGGGIVRKRFVSDPDDDALCRPGSDLLSRVLRRSTIGAEGFDGRVRNGIGSSPLAIATRPAKRMSSSRNAGFDLMSRARHPDGHGLMRVIKPIELLVPVSSTCRHASTPGLSTWSSSTALKGDLVLRWVSRLDAFSGYPVRT